MARKSKAQMIIKICGSANRLGTGSDAGTLATEIGRGGPSGGGTTGSG